MKLTKIVINDWVYFFPRVVLGNDPRVTGRRNYMNLFGGFSLGSSNAENWGNHQNKNFFINNSVELSMSDGPTETVKYIWVNTCDMLYWIFSQNCIN